MLAQILSTAALESRTNEDLARHLERVKKEGVATPMGQVFRALGWSLPGWGTLGEDGKPVDARTGRQLRAMDRIVALAPDATGAGQAMGRDDLRRHRATERRTARPGGLDSRSRQTSDRRAQARLGDRRPGAFAGRGGDLRRRLAAARRRAGETRSAAKGPGVLPVAPAAHAADPPGRRDPAREAQAPPHAARVPRRDLPGAASSHGSPR